MERRKLSQQHARTVGYDVDGAEAEIKIQYRRPIHFKLRVISPVYGLDFLLHHKSLKSVKRLIGHAIPVHTNFIDIVD